MDVAGDLEGTRPWYDCFIIIDVFDCAEAVSNGVFDHGDGVLIGSSDENGAGFGVFDAGNKSVLFLPQNVLLDQIGIAKVRFGKFLNGVDRSSAACQHYPLHIPPFGPPQRDYAGLREQLQTNRVDSFLVYHNEGLVVALRHLVLQLYDLPAALVSKSPLRLCHFVPVSGVGEEKLRIDLGLLILQGDVAGEQIAVLETLGHIRVSGAVVHDESLDQLGVSGQLVHHMHDFDHVQVNRLICDSDDVDCLDHDVHELVCQIRLQFRAQRRPSHADQQRFLNRVPCHFEALQKLQGLLPPQLIPFGYYPRVHLFLHQPLRLLHQFADQQHVRSGPIPYDVVLGRRGTGDHACGGVLDLHFVEQYAAVFGEFDLPCAAD